MLEFDSKLLASIALCAAAAACSGVTSSSSAGGAPSNSGGFSSSEGGATVAAAGASSGAGVLTTAGSAAGGGAVVSGSGSGGSVSEAAGDGGSAGTALAQGGTSGAVGGAGGALGAGAAGAAGANVHQGDLPAITLHLAGDSTVMDYGTSSAQEGWGQELSQFLISKVTIDNRALGGSSIQTFQSRWTPLVDSLKPGDFVMADFGINDSGSVAGRSVSTANFQMYLSRMNDQVKAKNANFIIVTPSALQYWSAGKETNERLAPYVAVEYALGMSKGIAIDDLNARSLEFLNLLGQAAAMDIYINGDKAHFTKKGATQMAHFVASELTRINSPLAAYLK